MTTVSGAEQRVRVFASLFPSPHVRVGVWLAEIGRFTWEQVWAMCAEAMLEAAVIMHARAEAEVVYTTETPHPPVVIDYGPEQTHCELDHEGGVCGRRLSAIRRLCPIHGDGVAA